jgi:hypothetical protein
MMKCKNHPRYQAKQRPRVACIECLKMYKDGLTAEKKRLNKALRTLELYLEDVIIGELIAEAYLEDVIIGELIAEEQGV